jgi:hypothetical protein
MLIDMLIFRLAMARRVQDQSGAFNARPRDFVTIPAATNSEPTPKSVATQG